MKNIHHINPNMRKKYIILDTLMILFLPLLMIKNLLTILLLMYDPKFVNNARFKDIRQTTDLKNAVKETVIICSSIGQ